MTIAELIRGGAPSLEVLRAAGLAEGLTEQLAEQARVTAALAAGSIVGDGLRRAVDLEVLGGAGAWTAPAGNGEAN